MTVPCHYCDRGAALDEFVLEVRKLSVSTLYLFREQSHPGRAIVAYDEHVGDIAYLSDGRRDTFFADVAKASRAIRKAFKPDKVNYASFGDTLQHIHFHLVPKYRDGFEWGGVFAMNPQKAIPSEEEYAGMAAKIREALE
jgi:diadenosine tetraphosphate (Ap4A) HIT family hydrolase